MYIRRTSIKSRKNGSHYYTYRLVESERTDKGVRQRTLINLGTGFSLPREQWSELASRIEEIISGQMQTLLFKSSKKIEEMAQRYASQIIQSRGKKSTEDEEPDYQEVDVNSLEMIRPRSVSCEHVAMNILILSLVVRVTVNLIMKMLLWSRKIKCVLSKLKK